MYTGKNRVARRSMLWLDQALMELLQTESYSEITVKDLCKKADLSRQTFYQLFGSKDEIMGYHFSGLLEKFKKDCGNSEQFSCRELVCRFFGFFCQEKEFISVLIDHHMTYFLEQQFEIYLPQISLFRNHCAQTTHPDYFVAYIAGGLTQTFVSWFQNGFHPDIDRLGELTEDIIRGEIYRKEMELQH